MIAKYRDSLQNLQQCKQRVMLEDLVAPAGARKKESPKTLTDLRTANRGTGKQDKKSIIEY